MKFIISLYCENRKDRRLSLQEHQINIDLFVKT